MANMANQKPYHFDVANKGTLTLSTSNKYVDRDIEVVIPEATISNGAISTPGWVNSLNSAIFSNGATNGVTYSEVTDNVVIPSGGYLYIDEGYTSAKKISLATLVPDSADIKTKGASYLYNATAYDNDGTLITGTMKDAVASVSGTTAASKPTIAKVSNTTYKSNVSDGTITKTKPSSGYYVSIVGTAPATTVTLTKEVSQPGYLSGISQITASASTSQTTGDNFFVPITTGKVTISNGTATKATVTYSSTAATFKKVSGTETATASGDIGYGVTGVLTSAPSSGSYIKITPSGTTGNGKVAPPSSAVTTAGYISQTSEVTLPTADVTVGVTATAGGTKYIAIYDGTYTFA